MRIEDPFEFQFLVDEIVALVLKERQRTDEHLPASNGGHGLVTCPSTQSIDQSTRAAKRSDGLSGNLSNQRYKGVSDGVRSTACVLANHDCESGSQVLKESVRATVECESQPSNRDRSLDDSHTRNAVRLLSSLASINDIQNLLLDARAQPRRINALDSPRSSPDTMADGTLNRRVTRSQNLASRRSESLAPLPIATLGSSSRQSSIPSSASSLRNPRSSSKSQSGNLDPVTAVTDEACHTTGPKLRKPILKNESRLCHQDEGVIRGYESSTLESRPVEHQSSIDSQVALVSTLGREIPRPYLTLKERKTLHQLLSSDNTGELGDLRGLEGQVVHVDYTAPEMFALIPSINAVLQPAIRIPESFCDPFFRSVQTLTRSIHARLSRSSEYHVTRIIAHARQRRFPLKHLLRTNDEDIAGFIRDASRQPPPSGACLLRIGLPTTRARVSDCPTVPSRRLALAHEMGTGHGRRGWQSAGAVAAELKIKTYESLRLWKTWPCGGSSDVITLAWAPDGNEFAAGCASLTDDQSMQYNRNNNLVMGDAETCSLDELPDHHVPRHRPATGLNSTDDMYNALDGRLFQTVTEVAFDASGVYMYSGSYDRTVKIWDVKTRSLLGNLHHDNKVDVVATSSAPGVFATGSQVIDGAIRVYTLNPNDPSASTHHDFSSQRAKKFLREPIHPSCLQWGRHPAVQHVLLGGFTAAGDDNAQFSRVGDLCLWDVNSATAVKVIPAAQNTFDCIWHPKLPLFASAVTADNRKNRGTRTYFRLYQWNGSGYSKNMDLECPALDMNTITWSEDEFFCTASCTDGNTYVWDRRMPDKALHILQHEEPLQTLPIPGMPGWRPREEADTGVRFAQWGVSNDRFYTGSSDGIVKAWNIKRAGEDAFIRDVVQLQAGIMSGSFSPDHSRLLLGDDAGGLSMLKVDLGKPRRPEKVETMLYRPAEGAPSSPRPTGSRIISNSASEDGDAGEKPINQVVEDVVNASYTSRACHTPQSSNASQDSLCDDSSFSSRDENDDYDFDCGLIPCELSRNEWEEISARKDRVHN
ncbi:MAG: hypothetical protein M1825_001884 [Sarcosagium campestre]|nr:MAG: hypothetical protein M1825_001884 [Sarcosagium campestre]